MRPWGSPGLLGKGLLGGRKVYFLYLDLIGVTVGSNGVAGFFTTGSQFRDFSLLRDAKCIEIYGLWLGIVISFIVAKISLSRGLIVYSL